MIPNSERTPVTDIECHSSHDLTSCSQTTQITGVSVFSDANFAWLLVQGAFGIHHVALHHFFLNLRIVLTRSGDLSGANVGKYDGAFQMTLFQR